MVIYGVFSFCLKFVNKIKYYIFWDGKMKEVNRNIKKLIDYLKFVRLKGYVKKNKLNFKKDEDLVKVLVYYESSMMKNK